MSRQPTVRTVAAGTTLAVRGEPAERLLVVESGTLTAVRETADGHRLRLGEFPASCTVDKAVVLGAGRYTATWSAAARAARAGLVRTEPGAVVVLEPGRLARRTVIA